MSVCVCVKLLKKQIFSFTFKANISFQLFMSYSKTAKHHHHHHRHLSYDQAITLLNHKMIIIQG